MPRGLPAGDCIDAPPPKGLRNSFAFACIGAGSGDLGTSICRIHRRSRCVGLTSDQPYRGITPSDRSVRAIAFLLRRRWPVWKFQFDRCQMHTLFGRSLSRSADSSFFTTRRRYRRKTPAPGFGLQLCRKSLTNIHVITFDVDVTQRPVALLLEFPKMT